MRERALAYLARGVEALAAQALARPARVLLLEPGESAAGAGVSLSRGKFGAGWQDRDTLPHVAAAWRNRAGAGGARASWKIAGGCVMARDKPHDWYDIEIEFKGKTVKGRYYVERNVVTVSTWADRKSTQVGGSPPESIARRLLHELAEAGKG
jgi:hypothetical protein